MSENFQAALTSAANDSSNAAPTTREEIETHIRELKEHRDLSNKMIEFWEAELAKSESV